MSSPRGDHSEYIAFMRRGLRAPDAAARGREASVIGDVAHSSGDLSTGHHTWTRGLGSDPTEPESI